LPQLPQNLLLSGTCGSAMIAEAGSRAGTGSISIRPAPSCPLDERLEPDLVLRLLGPLAVEPVPVRAMLAEPPPDISGAAC
jgi:hypothetical protein